MMPEERAELDTLRKRLDALEGTILEDRKSLAGAQRAILALVAQTMTLRATGYDYLGMILRASILAGTSDPARREELIGEIMKLGQDVQDDLTDKFPQVEWGDDGKA